MSVRIERAGDDRLAVTIHDAVDLHTLAELVLYREYALDDGDWRPLVDAEKADVRRQVESIVATYGLGDLDEAHAVASTNYTGDVITELIGALDRAFDTTTTPTPQERP